MMFASSYHSLIIIKLTGINLKKLLALLDGLVASISLSTAEGAGSILARGP